MNLNRNRALILVIAFVFVLSFLSLAFWKLKLNPIGYISQLFGKNKSGSSAFGKLKESSESSTPVSKTNMDETLSGTNTIDATDLTDTQVLAIKEAKYNLIGDYPIGKVQTLASSDGTIYKYISGFIVKAVSPADSKIRFLDKAGIGHDYNIKLLSNPTDNTFSVLEESSVDNANSVMAAKNNIINISDLVSKNYIRVNDQIIFGVLLRADTAPANFEGLANDLPKLQQIISAIQGKDAFPETTDTFVIPVIFEVIVPAK
jgi:hypothetical protein